MRKPAIVALIVMAGMISPIQSRVSFAQPAPAAAASTAASAQMADKDSAMKSLAAAKKKFRMMRKHSSQDPHAQADLDSQIKQINGVMAKLKKGEAVPQSDVDAAITTPAGQH
jgi:hypothetical protein